jgi:ABC-2 type transport system ATP-binding protein
LRHGGTKSSDTWGPNGSGKSTIANMLAGLTAPDKGEILFDGKNIQSCLLEYKSRLGYVPEAQHLYTYLSGREYLEMVGSLRRMPRAVLDRRIDDLLHLFSLYHQRHSPIASYSKGMRQKILISAAILHNPDILILDEPDSGLDITSAVLFKELVRQLAMAGKVVLYSSHIFEVVEQVCTRVLILHHGQLVADDSVQRLGELMQVGSLQEIFAQLVAQEDPAATAANIVQAIQN